MYKKIARFTLVTIGLLSLLFFYALTHLKFDYNFENFFPAGDEDLEFFLDYRESYKNDNDYLLIGIRNEEGIFEKEFLMKVDTLTRQLEELNLTEQVLSVTNLKNPVIGPLGIIQLPVLRVNEEQFYRQDSIRIYEDENLRGTLVAEDIPAVSVLINHRERISKADADLLMEQVNNILGNYSFDEIHLAGKAKAQSVYVEKMQEELLIFASASIFLVVIFLSVAYRSWWGVLVPLLVVILAAVWIAGIMSLTGKKLDVMLVLLPTIIFVVGMSDVVHILTRYIEELRNGKNKIKAIKITFREVGMATLLTSLTTAIGFLTLLTTNVSPIRDFGIYTAIGVFVAFFLAFTLLPAIMVLLKKPDVVKQKENRVLWTRSLGKTFFWVLRNKTLVLLGSAFVAGLSGYGISKLEINTFLLEDIRENDPLKKGFMFFDRHFGGSKPFEMAIIVKDSGRSVYDQEILQEIAVMENYLKTAYGTGSLVSPLLLVKGINKAMKGGLQEYYKLPEKEEDLIRIRQLINRMGKGPKLLQLTAGEAAPGRPLSGRISGKMADIGSRLSKVKNKGKWKNLSGSTPIPVWSNFV